MRRRWIGVPVVALAVVVALAGCTLPAPETTAWQGTVQTLASQASGGDYASASATLDQLEADVVAQRDAGTISADEATAILSRIETVRADLASLNPAPSPEPTTEQTPEPTVADTPEPAQDTVVDDGPSQQEQPPQNDDKGPGNPGKGGGGKGGKDDSTGPGGPGKKDG